MVELIQEITEGLTEVKAFIHGTRSWQNLISEKSIFGLPAVYLDEPLISNDTIMKSGYVQESYPLKMFFLDKSELSWTPDQHQEVIVSMRTLRRKFLAKMMSDERIREVNYVRTTDVMNILDHNLSGCLLEITVVPFNSDPNCG